MLVDPLPETVEIGGKEYVINTDFRVSVLYELLMQDDEVSDREKVRQALLLYYPEIPNDVREAVHKILWFYGCGKAKPGKQQDQEQSEDEAIAETEKVYSFEYDDGYIYAAFMSQYGIDLADIEYLHWWKFRAMFKALEEKTEFMKIIGYRSVDITSKMPEEQKKYYRRMKSIHALPVSEKEQEAEDKIIEALRNGQSLDGLL